jgi:FtsH-binding integral membrane protein
MANSSIYNRLFQSKSYSQKGGAFSLKNNLLPLLKEKQGFLLLVFANLIVQLGITYYFFLKTNLKNKKYLWPIFIAQIALILIIGLIPMPSFMKLILFCIFSSIGGVLLSLIKTPTNSNIIQGAILSALSIFTFMVFAGAGLIAFGVNLGYKFGMILFSLLLLLIIFQLVNIFFTSIDGLKKIFAYAGLVLFSVFVIYDTNTILQRNYYGDFITASMDYYLDIINIVMDIFTINSN